MSAATIALIIAAIQAAITQAPQIASIVMKGKEFISNLFSEGLITVEQQNSMHAHVDQVSAAAIAGNLPPSWSVEPDPVV